jgi:hypothetical protein
VECVVVLVRDEQVLYGARAVGLVVVASLAGQRLCRRLEGGALVADGGEQPPERLVAERPWPVQRPEVPRQFEAGVWGPGVTVRVLASLSRGVRVGECRSRRAEGRHVRTTEPVDRLLLVADEQDVGVERRCRVRVVECVRVGAGEQLDQLPLFVVRILHLVDHHVVELVPDGVAERGLLAEEIDRVGDEILEV